MIKLFILLAFTVVFCKNPPAVETFTVGDVEFKMIKVQNGTFYMGAQNSDPQGINYDPNANWVGEFYSESPVHKVTLTNDYYLGETEVTQGLWKAVMGSLPEQIVASSNSSHSIGDDYPIYAINWPDMVGTENSKIGYTINKVTYYENGFCYKLSQLVGGGKQFRLPTEAEWEYAARGGNVEKNQTVYSGSNNISDVAWYNRNSGYRSTVQKVATKLANALGIYDMNGNVVECCSDLWRDYNNENQTNPIGLVNRGQKGLFRGGDCMSAQEFCRVSSRAVNLNSISYSFRLALSVSAPCDICK